jgi:hypothetical protein
VTVPTSTITAEPLQDAESASARTWGGEPPNQPANALTPNGQTVASQLLARNPNALAISTGGSGGPGVPGAGSMSLYNAVKFASKQPPSTAGRSGRLGSQYCPFGNGGTPACAAAAKLNGVVEAAAGTHCLLAGPDNPLDSVPRAQALNQLYNGLPTGVNPSQGQLLVVPPGTVVLQAVSASFSTPPKFASPTTQFYVLKDNVALYGNDITNLRQSTDTAGNPDVEFGFTPTGAREFTRVTAAIARRGSLDSPPSQQLNQHFAVALDNLLITVPPIDFTTYPFGVPASRGAEISGGLTKALARDLTTELRLGALPIGLKLIRAKPLAAHG